MRTLVEKPANILLVEDDDVDVMNVRRVFKKANIPSRLFIARDGVEALDMLRRNELPKERRLLVLDLNMPRMNGLELLREIRADSALLGTPAVVLTTSSDELDKGEAYRLNVAGYLIKPITFPSFVDLFQTLNRYWSTMELP